MNGKFYAVMRLVSIFVILVGVGGLFSSIWSGIADFVFSNGMMIPQTICNKLTNYGAPSQTFESVESFAVDVNGTRYECSNQVMMSMNYAYSNLRYQVPGMFMFSLVIGFGAFLYRYASKHEKQG